MLVIPSINIINGQAVDVIASASSFSGYYNEISGNPLELCKLWRSENAKTLHINCLDDPISPSTHQTILNLIECVDIPVTLSANSNSIDDCQTYLDKGIFRVALSQFLYDNQEIARKLIQKYSANRIIFFAITKNSQVQLKEKDSKISFSLFLELMLSVGAERLIYGNVDWDSSCETPNYDFLKEIYNSTNFKITLYNGVKNFKDLQELQYYKQFGVDSLILSKPLYENNFPCQEIWRIAETF